MTGVEDETMSAQREAVYQEIKRRMASLDESNERQLRYFFSVMCIHVRHTVPVFALTENEALWQRWIEERRENCRI